MLISNFKKILITCCLALAISAGTCFAIDNTHQNVKHLSATESSVPLLEGGVSITKSPRLITMSLRESDTRQVLRMLADKAGMNIILHESVSGTVTLDLVNITLNKAFEYVMVLNNLAYWVDGNTLIVASKDASKDLAFAQQEIRTFNVKYENAGRIAEFLNKNVFTLKNPGLSSDEVALSNPNTNQVMIVGTQKDFEITRKIIDQFDKKTETTMFTVNHLAPGKMAGIICHKVFKSDDIKDEDSDSEGKGGAKIACSSKDIEGSEVEGTFTSFKSNGLVVTYYPDDSKIGITGATKEQLELVDEVIAQNDVKQKQAIIEFAFLELSADGTRELSPSWGISAGKFALTATDGSLGFTFGNNTDNGNFAMETKIVASIQNGKGRVLSNPKVLVKNNTESTVDVTQEYISNISTQLTTTTTSPVQSQTVETDDYGIKVTVKPTITNDGYIYMDLTPSYSTPNGTFNVTSDTNPKEITLLAERDVEMKGIRLKDNETLIIAGLIYEKETKSINKVPVLGDIPFLGVAFRSSKNATTKNELIILVTPKIITDEEDIVERM